ncbi:hypothetical protein M4I21_12805 [Cellulophaga sp. 20_2_10]|uniref:hypothetical protein n=1 Tax=Cellulophaga sp. 20_2_10 TaxID=2942476 RepID=UPI00201A7280|nr:hypothetical protein [Cellulophaga sp. 20_2_10]MCL5246697.1 hypothetical protein [Cellulophaga sp. 20_2_10]
MTLRIIITLLFTVFSSTLVAQASWGYSVKFKLISKENDTISIDHFKSGKIKLLSAPFGSHSNNKLEFDYSSNSFIFSQHTIATGSILVFETLKDKTILNVQTINLDLKTIKLTGKNYSIHVWNNEEKFIKIEEKDTYWKLKHPFETYFENNKKFIPKNLDVLVEVKIK